MPVLIESPEGFAERAAGWIANAIRSTVETRGSCAVALSGGNTPKEVYRRIPALPAVPWRKVEIYFGDERAVPPGDPSSNYRMAQESLLGPAGIPAERVHRMEADRRDITQAARDYEALLPEALDLLILGIGTDGHTASLFPYAPSLAERNRRVIQVVGGEPLTQRLTITPPVIETARGLLILARGAAKAEAVAMALEGHLNPTLAPAQLARHGIWMLDRDAASRLRATY